MKKSEIDSESIRDLTDEELNRIAGGRIHPCPLDCIYRDNHCDCPDKDIDLDD